MRARKTALTYFFFSKLRKYFATHISHPAGPTRKIYRTKRCGLLYYATLSLYTFFVKFPATETLAILCFALIMSSHICERINESFQDNLPRVDLLRKMYRTHSQTSEIRKRFCVLPLPCVHTHNEARSSVAQPDIISPNQVANIILIMRHISNHLQAEFLVNSYFHFP